MKTDDKAKFHIGNLQRHIRPCPRAVYTQMTGYDNNSII